MKPRTILIVAGVLAVAYYLRPRAPDAPAAPATPADRVKSWAASWGVKL